MDDSCGHLSSFLTAKLTDKPSLSQIGANNAGSEGLLCDVEKLVIKLSDYETQAEEILLLSPLDPDIKKMKVQKKVTKSSLEKYLSFKSGGKGLLNSVRHGVQILILLLMGYVSLGKLLYLSVLECTYLQSKDNNIFLLKLLYYLETIFAESNTVPDIHQTLD